MIPHPPPLKRLFGVFDVISQTLKFLAFHISHKQHHRPDGFCPGGVWSIGILLLLLLPPLLLAVIATTVWTF
jgi:hypothetical protein